MAASLATLTWGTRTGIVGAGEALDEPPGRGEAVLHADDRRFRRQFNLALFRLRGRGEISSSDYWRFRNASFNAMELKDEKAFVQLLREECEQKAGDLMDDLVKWWEWLTEWIIENWKTVLQVVLSLLVFLEAAE